MLEVALATHRIAAGAPSLLPTHPQYGALRTRCRSPSRRTRPSLTAFGSTWTAGAGCRATWQNILSSTSPPSTPLWSRMRDALETPRHRRAIERRRRHSSTDGDGGDPPPGGKCRRASQGSRGQAGYVSLRQGRQDPALRQPPGRATLSVQLKFVMYNPYNIYLHAPTRAAGSTARSGRCPTAA